MISQEWFRKQVITLTDVDPNLHVCRHMTAPGYQMESRNINFIRKTSKTLSTFQKMYQFRKVLSKRVIKSEYWAHEKDKNNW